MLKIALIQQAYAGSKQKQAENSCSAIKEAAESGAQLVCLSELHQSEYFCQSENVAFFDLAQDFERDVAFWGEVARENGVVLITSLFERRAAGLYHNTAVVFEKDGSIAGKYRKMHIPDDPNFYEKFYFTPGDLGFEPINTSLGRLGVMICWDQWYPEAARIMALKGAQMLIYPTAIGHFDSDSEDEKARQLGAWLGVQRAHAIANGLFVVAINRTGFERDSSGVSAGIRFWGHSFIYGPQGEELLQAKDAAGVFIAELDLKHAEEVRRWWPFLRDRRIECYKDLEKRFID